MMKKANYLILCCLLLIAIYGKAKEIGISEEYSEAVSCSVATPILCNTTTWVNASNVNRINKTDYNIASCLITPSSYNGMDHVYKINAGATPNTLSINVTNLTADLDMFLFRNCSSVPGDFNFNTCVAVSANGNSAPESLTVPNASGEYYLVIDGREYVDRSGYKLTVTCNGGSPPPPPPPPPPAGNCTPAYTLSCGESLYVPRGGNNSFNEDNYNFVGCSHANYSYEGYDHVIRLNIGASPRNISISMTGLNADMDMFLFKTCSDHYGNVSFSNCKGYSDNSGNNSERIDVYGASGTYILVVDGFTHGVNSSFNISLNCNSSPSFNCYSAVPLNCGDQKWFPASYANHLDNSSYNFSGCYGPGHYGYSGNDHLFKINAGTGYGNQLVINMSGLSADLDLLLFKSCGDHYGNMQLTDCVDFSTRNGNASEEIIVDNAQGTYYLSVDGTDPWYNSGFDISVTCHTYAPDICAIATPLSCGDRRWVNAPTTNHLDSRHYNYTGCLGYNYGYTGNDHLYKIDAGHSYGDMTIKMTGLTADLDLLLFKSCENHYGQSTLSNCVDFSVRSGTSYEEIVVHNASGIYYLAVDADDPWYTSGYEIFVNCAVYTPDICEYATPIYCGETTWVNAATHNNLDRRNYDYSGCWSYNYGFEGKDHLYVIHAGPQAKDITIKISNLSADLDMLLYRSCGSHYGQYGLSECLDYSIKSGISSEEINIQGATGTYYLAVDANDPWDWSGYELSMYCHEEVQYNCQNAIPLTCGESRWSEAPTKNHISGSAYLFADCVGSGNAYIGYDHLYKIDLGNNERHLKVELTNLTSDLDLLIFKSCSPSYSNARLGGCQDYSAKSGYASEIVDIEHAKGVYYIVVDSKSIWDLSGYKIKVHCIDYPPTGGGDDPIDDPIDPVDDPVENPDLLTCGGFYSGSTVGGMSEFDNADIKQCFTTNLLYTGPDELVPFEKVSDNDIIELILTQDDANLSLFILDENLDFVDVICKGANYSSNKLIENDHIVGEVYSDEGALSAGKYYALIEGYNRTIASDFTLSLACGDPCANAETIECESVIIGAMTSDSSNTRNIYNLDGGASYVGYTGGEWSATLVVDTTIEITIDLYNINANGDLDLFLLDSCNATVVLAASTNADSLSEQIIRTLNPGLYTVVVDGWHQGQGTFDIEITGCGDVIAAFGDLAGVRKGERFGSADSGITLQVMPNPFKERTDILINSAAPSSGSLHLYTMDGRLLYKEEIVIRTGINRIRLDEAEFKDQFGLIVYKLITEEKTFQGAMIKVK